MPRLSQARFRRDLSDASVRFDTGHFALERHGEQIAVAIRGLLE